MRVARINHRFLFSGLCGLATVLLLGACGDNMRGDARYKPLEPAGFFADEQSSRPLVPNTIAQQQSAAMPMDELATELPMELTPEVLKRGQERFEIYCSPCHGRDGYGEGMIVQRGFTPPPSYHIDRLRDAPVGYFHLVPTNGKGAMYSYAARVSSDDRWKIAAYIRTLQLSQHMAAQDIPQAELEKLKASVPDKQRAKP